MFFFPTIPILMALTEPDSDLLEQSIAEVATGDATALETLYREAKSAVYGFALSYLKNAHDAEDVLHDTFVSVWSAAAGYQAQGKPMAWLLTITKNLCLDRLRRQTKQAELPDEERSDLFAEREDLSQEDKWLLQQTLQGLSEEERQIIMLHAIGGLKHREIAAMLDLVLPTVLSKYRRGLKKLKETYEKEGLL